MQSFIPAHDSRDAVARFAAAMHGRAPARIDARWDGLDGMAALSVVEAAIADLWPAETAKELVWMKRAGVAAGEVLHLRACAANGVVLGAGAFLVG